jgi:polyhydroxybutyrate depolymerase
MRSPSHRGLLLVALLVAVVSTVAAACGSSKSSGGSASPTPTPTPRVVFGDTRPVSLQVTPAYDGTAALPLLIILHGYGGTGAIQQAYMRLNGANTADMFVLAPDGTLDSTGKRFWNTPACCNFDLNPVDDVAYIKSLIAAVEGVYKVDPKRVFLLGHSNGAFMAHRMACEDAAEIAAVVSLAGATFLNPADCVPANPVSILEIHSITDETILYAGGSLAPGVPAYPGALETVAHWQVNDGCTPGLVAQSSSMNLDLIVPLPGAETQISKFDGCPAGIGVEHWSMTGAPHIPTLTPDFAVETIAWLKAHPRP